MMKNAFVALTLLVLSTAVHAGEPIQLRALSYNIHHAEGIDKKLDLERIAGVIRSVKPDLVALQEVDKKASRSDRVDQPAELARLTKMHAIFGANIRLQGGHYGNAILSRFPISEHKNHLLPNVNSGEQRGLLVAEISVPKLTSPLKLMATHLDHRRDDRERVQSVEAINALVAQSDQPSILMGDLNDVVGSETLSRLEQVWKNTSAGELHSFPVSKPKRQIDFILCYPSERWSVVESRILDQAVASDHRAILSILQWNAD